MENVDDDLMKLIEVVCSYFKCDPQEREILIKEAKNEPSQFKDSMKEIYENTIKNIIQNSEASTIKVDNVAPLENVVENEEKIEIIVESSEAEVLVEKILSVDATENFNGVRVDTDTYKILEKIVDVSNIKTTLLNNAELKSESIEVREPPIVKVITPVEEVTKEIVTPKLTEEVKPSVEVSSSTNRFSRFSRQPTKSENDVVTTSAPAVTPQTTKPIQPIPSVEQKSSSDDFESRTFSAKDTADINEQIVKSMSGSKAFRG